MLQQGAGLRLSDRVVLKFCRANLDHTAHSFLGDDHIGADAVMRITTSAVIRIDPRHLAPS